MVIRQLPAPNPELRAVVVVPARDEEDLIGGCITALAGQDGVAPAEWEVLLVLDGCVDDTGGRASSALAGHPGITLHEIVVEGLGAGGARAAGMDLGCERLEAVGRPDGLIATTDADSEVAPDWLARQLKATAGGAAAIGGLISLKASSSRTIGAETLARRDRDHAGRLAAVSGEGPTEHPFFGGASIGITARAYRAVGGMEPLEALEDEALARRLRSAHVDIHRLSSVRVNTSARTEGRAVRGLARDLAASEWSRRRTWKHTDFSLDGLLRRKERSISLILPAKDVAETIGPILGELEPLRTAGLIDELIVVEAGSADGTAEVASSHGATVIQESDPLAEFGPCRGKGDAMWRAVFEATGEIIVFCDADSTDFSAGFVTGLLGPILTEPAVRLVKGAFERPFQLGESVSPGEGGRVTELVARPLINLYRFELASLEQPLAGEIAIERDLFEQLSVPVGYGVEIGMLLDAADLAGIDAIAQCRLGSRQNRHQSLRSLSAMAYEVTVAFHRRLGDAPEPAPGPLLIPGVAPARLSPRCEERPPLASLRERVRAVSA